MKYTIKRLLKCVNLYAWKIGRTYLDKYLKIHWEHIPQRIKNSKKPERSRIKSTKKLIRKLQTEGFRN